MALDRRRIYRTRHRLRQLRAFCHAVRLGSFAQAAEQLGLSTPAVSLHVRELEHELKSVLFERGRGGVTPTLAGERFHALARPLVERMEGLFGHFAERAEDDMTGSLSVAASAAGTAFVLPRYVRRLRDLYPHVQLRVRNCCLDEGAALLRAAEVELVLGAHDLLRSEALEYHEMLSYDLVLITSRDHPLAGREAVTPEEAARWPAIVPPAGSRSRKFGETAARGFGVDVKSAVEVGGWGVIKRYVEQGLGISVVPSLCLHEFEQVSVIPLSKSIRSRSYGVYTRRGKALSAPARAFLGLLIPGLAGEWRRAGARSHFDPNDVESVSTFERI